MKIVETPRAPIPAGHYSQAVVYGGLVLRRRAAPSRRRASGPACGRRGRADRAGAAERRGDPGGGGEQPRPAPFRHGLRRRHLALASRERGLRQGPRGAPPGARRRPRQGAPPRVPRRGAGRGGAGGVGRRPCREPPRARTSSPGSPTPSARSSGGAPTSPSPSRSSRFRPTGWSPSASASLPSLSLGGRAPASGALAVEEGAAAPGARRRPPPRHLQRPHRLVGDARQLGRRGRPRRADARLVRHPDGADRAARRPRMDGDRPRPRGRRPSRRAGDRGRSRPRRRRGDPPGDRSLGGRNAPPQEARDRGAAP